MNISMSKIYKIFWKKLKNTQINGTIDRVHEMVELILLKQLQKHTTVITILKENKKVKELTLPNFNTYYKDTRIKTVEVLAKEQTNPETQQKRQNKNKAT